MLEKIIKKSTKISFLVTAVISILNVEVKATVPDAGSLQQNIEQELKQNITHQVVSIKIDEKSTRPDLKGPTFTIDQVIFSGNTLFTNTQLNLVVDSYLSHLIDFNQLQSLIYSLETAYLEKGYFARIILPEQELNNKTIKIVIEEGFFGKIKMDGNITRIKPKQITDLIEKQQKYGELLKVDRLDRGLLLSSDLRGLKVDGMLVQGDEPKTIDLLLKVEDRPFTYINLLVDNAGPISMGEDRFIADMGIESPIKLGDLFSVTYLTSSGSDYLRAYYTIPVGNNGFNVAFFGSSLDYSLVSSSFSALNANGTSTARGMEANYPLIRSRDKNLYISANLDSRQFKNSSLDQIVSNYSSKDYSMSMYGNFFDSISSGGLNNMKVSLILGNIDLDDSPNKEAVATTNNAKGDFTKIRYSVKREQSIGKKFILALNIQGQITDDNLDSSEKFYLGGSNGVRGYPANEGAGSSGYLGNIELSQILPHHLVIATFFDYGAIEQNSDNDFVGASTPNNYTLKGIGLSLAWHPNSTINLKSSWASRIGSNPNPLTNGDDQDGTNIKNRFWFEANMNF